MDQGSPGGHHSVKLVGPGHAETVHASEKFDKTGLLAAHHAALHDAYMLERGLLPGTSLPDSEAPPIPPVYADSPWKDFKPLRLAEMKIGKTHRRHVLEGRLCAKSLKVTSVVNVLEQDSGLATKLILTNALPVRASMAQAQNCYPEGSRVAVRDPYLTRFPDGVVGVLVERPNDIAFLSRPEDTGDHLVYGAVGLEGYEDERSAHHDTLGRDQEDFSRKIHLFEQQMKQEQLAQLESLDSRRLSGMFQRPVAHGAAHHREDASAHARSSPPKAEAKEMQSPAKEERVIRASNNTAEESVVASAAPVDRLQDSPPLPQGGIVEDAQEEPTPSPAPRIEEEPHLEATHRVALTEDPVEEPTTPKAEERRGVKDVETPEEESLESVPDVLPSPQSLELSREAPRQDAFAAAEEVAERPEVAAAEEVAERPEVAEVTKQPEIAADKELAESDKAAMEPIAEESVSGKQEDTSEEQQLETLGNGKTLAPESKRPAVRKQFQRSDSLVTVQEVEDSKAARALGTTGAAAASSRGESTEETPTPERKEEAVTTIEIPPESHPESHPPESHSANDLRVLGNVLFGEENFQGAADLYTRSIRIAESEEQREGGKPVRNSEIILGYSNRAEAYIRLHEFGNALADAKKALSRDPSHLKSLFRKGRALLGLSQYEQALTTLQAAAPRAPTDRDLQAALHESSTGVQQSRHGHYDLAHYYLKGKPAGESPFSVDYVGPVMATDVGRGRGRGLVLTRDVEAGELLLVSNPMAFLPLTDPTRHEVSQAFVDGKVQEGFRVAFEAAHHKGLEKLPTLYDGEKVLPAPSVTLTDAEAGPHEVLHLDPARVRRIVQLNAINGDATMGWKNLPGSGEHDKKVEHWGLWWLPSFINHSCLPSCSPVLVGKALFVFAARDLRAGDEVTRAYFDIFQPLEQRKELSTKGWGFVCYCRRCKLEDALHTSLSKVTEQYTKLMELASKSKSEFGTDEQQLSETQASTALRFFHKLESKLKDFKLNGAENNWVRASFLHYIDMISGDLDLHTHLESIVDALVAVCPGSETTLHMAVVAKDSARRTFGKKSVQFKSANQRALNVCRFTYGKQKASVLQAIVDRNEYQS